MGREPFSKIMQAVENLRPNEALQLIAPFEPYPLYAVLGRQGFSHESQQTGHGTWEVVFKRGNAASAVEQTPATRSCAVSEMVEVDARGLEPPQPLVVILEALATLPENAELNALTDRRPLHLYPHIEDRGFVGETQKQADGSFVTHIRRP